MRFSRSVRNIYGGRLRTPAALVILRADGSKMQGSWCGRKIWIRSNETGKHKKSLHCVKYDCGWTCVIIVCTKTRVIGHTTDAYNRKEREWVAENGNWGGGGALVYMRCGNMYMLVRHTIHKKNREHAAVVSDCFGAQS